MKDAGKHTVKYNLWFDGKKTALERDEEFVEASLGELLKIYVDLKTLPWWRKIFRTRHSLEDQFALEDIEKILSESTLSFPNSFTKYFPLTEQRND